MPDNTIRNIQSASGRLEGNSAATTAHPTGVSAHQRSLRQTGLTSCLKNGLFARTSAQRSPALSRQPTKKISTMRVIVGVALGVGIGVALGGPVGLGVGAVIGATYILVGPQAMWQVVQKAGRAVAVHAQQHRTKAATLC